jgi:hypothetical protein
VYGALRGLAMAGYPPEVISIFQVLDEIAGVIVVAMTCMKLIIALYAVLFK